MPSLLSILTNSLIFIFPALANLVAHAASILFGLFGLLGIIAWFTRKQSSQYSRTEKIIMLSFLGYFIVCFSVVLIQVFIANTGMHQWNPDHVIRMTAMIPIYYLFLRTGIKARSFWFGIALGAIASAIYAILFVYVWHADVVNIRARGPVHPIPFGDISLALGFISMAGFRYFEDMHPALVTIPLVALVSGIFAAFLSGTRGALIAIPLLMVLFLVQMGRYPRYRMFRLIILSVLPVLLFGAYYLPGSPAKTRIQSMITVTMQYFSGKPTRELQDTQQRLAMWTQALKMIQQHPFIGVGRDGFHRIIKEKAKSDPVLQAVVERESPHNMYLTAWTAYGLGGLIVVLGVLLSPLLIFLPAIRRDGPVRELAYAGVMGIAAFMQFALTESIFYRNININFYIVLTAAALALIKLNENKTYKRDHR